MQAQTEALIQKLAAIGLHNLDNVYWNLSTGALYEEIVRRKEGLIAHLGALVVRTGEHTGRAPKDKYIVRGPETENDVWWESNPPFTQEQFANIYQRLTAYLQGRDVYVQDVYAGADPDFQISVRVITELAWHNLFARNLFIRPKDGGTFPENPDFTVVYAPHFRAVPEVDGTRSSTFIVLDFHKKMVVIGGTSYAGELKKSVFTILNYLLPKKNVFPMHCSANVGKDGKTALFFGLSGTGKTTLSADPERLLIGDDEHGWGANGVFNFEGGCYAKVINLSAEGEPEIFATTRMFGTVLENVGIDVQNRLIDLFDGSLTENTRAAYPITHLPRIVEEGMGTHPNHVFFLTCDAFGVLPPIAELNAEQAMYHFISGYTAKVAGTEKGLGNEPQATFSACFGLPFLPRHPFAYAKLLKERMTTQPVRVWLVNTGWTGGPFGVGTRMKLKYTRRLLNAALEGELSASEMDADPIFGVRVPRFCEGVPTEILKPRNTWPDKGAYDQKAAHLAKLFQDNFRNFEAEVSDEVKTAAPKL